MDTSHELDMESESINDVFPNEILEEILSKLDSQTDLLQARLVCHRWRHILDEMVGYSVTLTSFYADLRNWQKSHKLSLPQNPKSINSMNKHSNMALRHLMIGIPGTLIDDSLTNVIACSIVDLLNYYFEIPFPHVLKSLSCFEPFCPKLISFLPSMTTLTSLNISLLSLINLNPKTSFTSSSMNVLRSLKTLTISETESYPAFNSSWVIPQLNSLLDHLNCPVLLNLDVTYPVLNLLSVDEDSTRHIMNFLGRSHSVRKLSIMISSPSQDLITPTKEFQYPLDIQEEMGLLGRKLHLTSSELRDNHLHSLRPSTQVKAWTALLKQQRGLRSLEFSLKSSIELTEDAVFVIQNNAKTLKTLTLACFPCEIRSDTRDIYFIPVDSYLLSGCGSLEHFRICDTLINTISLPRSLKSIYIDAMLTNKDAHDILLLLNGALERIELKDSRGGIPKGFGYGVAIESLETFVKERRIQRLVIYPGSLDGIYPTEGIPNGDPILPRPLHRRASPTPCIVAEAMLTPVEYEKYLSECVRLNWVVNGRGYYYDDIDVKDYNEATSKIEDQAIPLLTNSSDTIIPANEGEEDKTIPPIKHQLFNCSSLMTSFM